MIEIMNPGSSFLLDPALEEWMVRKHHINQAKVQVQVHRIKLSYPSPWCKGSEQSYCQSYLSPLQPQLYFVFYLPSFSAPCHSGDVTVGVRQGRQPAVAWEWRWAGARSTGAGGGEVGCSEGAAAGSICCPSAG